MIIDSTFTTDDYFLSALNPLANRDQRDQERLALAMLQSEKITLAKEGAKRRLKALVAQTAPAEAWSSFDAMMDEWAFVNVLKALNSDGNYPKVLSNIYADAHQWFELDVPASRGFGGDNPDTIYSIAPIHPGVRYILKGKRLNQSIDAPLQLTSNVSVSSTISVLDWGDVVFSAGGDFEITIDPTPANGRHNHLQTSPDVRYLFLRDTRSDWRDCPNAYHITRLDPPSAPPLTQDELITRAALYITDEVGSTYFFLAMISSLPANMITPAVPSGGVGGLVTARIAMGHLQLQDNEAYVLTLGQAGAHYRGVTLMDFWQRSLRELNKTNTYTQQQAVANEEGTTTFVIANQDPGIHNWIDALGLEQPRLIIRWQGLPAGSEDVPVVKGELVSLAELDTVLPKNTQRITPAERVRQLQLRQAQAQARYQWR